MVKKMKKFLPPISFLFHFKEGIKTFPRNIGVGKFYKLIHDDLIPNYCLKTFIDLIGVLLKDYGLDKNSNNVSMRDVPITDKKRNDCCYFMGHGSRKIEI